MDVKISDDKLDNFGLGRLISEERKAEVHYQPYEVSQHRLGIVAPRNCLKCDEHLVLKTSFGDVPFIVEEVNEKDHPFGLVRYRLHCPVKKVSVEDVFRKSGCEQYFTGSSSGGSIQRTRFKIDPSIVVKAKTFGTRIAHDFHTINISKSGFLLASGHNVKVPFIQNTLLELALEVDGFWIKEPVNCLGKVVRCLELRDARNESIKHYGIRITEMSGKDEQVWEKTLSRIEENPLPSSTT
jgi:hypothetical protein